VNGNFDSENLEDRKNLIKKDQDQEKNRISIKENVSKDENRTILDSQIKTTNRSNINVNIVKEVEQKFNENNLINFQNSYETSKNNQIITNIKKDSNNSNPIKNQNNLSNRKTKYEIGINNEKLSHSNIDIRKDNAKTQKNDGYD